MAPTRTPHAIAFRLAGLFAVICLLSLAMPPIAMTYWEPPPIAKDGPKDPGTPFEEPEGTPPNDTGDQGPKALAPIQPAVRPADAARNDGSSWIVPLELALYRIILIRF